ncbi:MAG: hypothetical protein CSB46_09575 [Micrococcales bacterium]|nr:MAG: hypothetical protein CSB46_09575 [Micrococcales bacterium]
MSAGSKPQSEYRLAQNCRPGGRCWAKPRLRWRGCPHCLRGCPWDGVHPHRRPHADAWIAGLAALVGVALTAVIGLGTSLVDAEWIRPYWALIAVAVAVLVALAVGLAVAAHRLTAGDADADGPGQRLDGSEGGAVQVGGDNSGPIAAGPEAAAVGVFEDRSQHVHQYAAPPQPVPVIAAERVVVGQIPAAPVGWVPRPELDELAAALEGQSRAVVCAGGRGMGKSAVAAEYTRQAMQDPAGPRVIAWITADSEQTLLTGLGLLAERARVADPELDAAANAARARDYLNGLQEPALLVLDNAEHPELVRNWLPANSHACAVLLTSTDRRFTDLASEVHIDVYLPLALAQAAPLISRQCGTYAEYLNHLQSVSLDHALPQGGSAYPRGLAQATLLSIRTATGRNQDCKLVLDTVAVLDPGGVPRELLASLIGQQAAALDTAIGVLIEHSLLERSVDGSGVVMHRLVARFVREQAHADGRLERVLHDAAETLAGTLPSSPPPLSLADATTWTTHMLAVLGHAEEPEASDEVRVQVSHHAAALCGRLFGRGYPATELTLDEATLRIRERVLGAEHPDTLISRGNLAADYRAVGRHQDALTLNEETLTLFERVLGAEHPSTLTSRNNLALDYSAVGRHQDALTLDQETLALRERNDGP